MHSALRSHGCRTTQHGSSPGVEQQTDLRIEYDSIDARLRWFGPEIVLRGVRVLERDGSEALLLAREGSVGLDLRSLFRTGELVAGRVRFTGPTLTVVRFPDGRVRLLGQNERPLDRPPFDLDRLPAGWLVVGRHRHLSPDLASGVAPATFTGIQLDPAAANTDGTAVTGSARLPATLGRSIDFRGDLRGRSSISKRSMRSSKSGPTVSSWRGLAPFLPTSVARPTTGSGGIQGQVRFNQGKLAHARLDLDLADLGLELPQRDIPTVPTLALSAPANVCPARLPWDARRHRRPSTIVQRPAAAGPATVRYPRLRGTVRLRHDDREWMLRAQNLNFGSVGGRTGAPAAMSLHLARQCADDILDDGVRRKPANRGRMAAGPGLRATRLRRLGRPVTQW